MNTKYYLFFILLQIRLWELSDSRVQCIRTIGGHSNVIVRLVLSGSRAASRDLDGNILIWDLNDALTQNYNHEGNLLRSIVIWLGVSILESSLLPVKRTLEYLVGCSLICGTKDSIPYFLI